MRKTIRKQHLGYVSISILLELVVIFYSLFQSWVNKKILFNFATEYQYVLYAYEAVAIAILCVCVTLSYQLSILAYSIQSGIFILTIIFTATNHAETLDFFRYLFCFTIFSYLCKLVVHHYVHPSKMLKQNTNTK